MFTENIDAHNLIVELLNEPVNNKNVISWIFRNKHFLCVTYSTIKKMVLKELNEINKCHHGKIVIRKEGIEDVFKYFEELLQLSIVVRKFNNIKQAVGFINLLILEYYVNGIKDEEKLLKYKGMILPTYKKILSDLRNSKVNTRCGYLLEKVLEHLTDESDFYLLREIARMEDEYGALAPLLCAADEPIGIFKPSLLGSPLNKQEGKVRQNIECVISFEEPITCPVILSGSINKKFYDFNALEQYMSFNIKKIKKLNKYRRNKIMVYLIPHPILQGHKYGVTARNINMAWEHLKPEIQAVCCKKDAPMDYSLEKLHSLVLEQVNKKKYDFRQEEYLGTNEDESQALLLSI